MPQTLLIIDDSRPLHELIKVHLDSQDIVCESAYTGSAALSVAATLRPDLILLDLDLPDINGFDVCRFLKSDPLIARIPIIFLTASSSVDEKICGLDLLAADYMTKPFDPAELTSRVRAALRTKRLLDQLPHPRSAVSQLHAERYRKPWQHTRSTTIASG